MAFHFRVSKFIENDLAEHLEQLSAALSPDDGEGDAAVGPFHAVTGVRGVEGGSAAGSGVEGGSAAGSGVEATEGAVADRSGAATPPS